MHDKRLFGRHPNTTQLLHHRSYYDVETLLRNRLQTAPALMDRLALDAELNGHTGCVNGLDWSANGRLIASVSDDRCLRIWDAFRQRCLVDLNTVHQGNVFAVKFVPQTGDRRVVTGAADCKVCVYDLERGDGPLMQCTCHRSRVKSVAVLPDSPDMLWTSAEDGMVCQFDLRAPHSCQFGKDQVMLINLFEHVGPNIEIKSIAINARRPEMLAVGASDPYARVYDRRQLSVQSMHTGHNIPMGNLHNLLYTQGSRRAGPATVAPETTVAVDIVPESCVQYFCPGHLMSSASTSMQLTPFLLDKTVTYVTFSPVGDELLVNMGSDHVYLFDVNGQGRPQHIRLPKMVEAAAAATVPPTLSDAAEAHKLRGNAQMQSGHWMQAIDAYGAGIRLAPTSAVLYQNRAAAYMKRDWYGDVYAALRDCQQALSLDPGYVKAHFRWTKALLKLNRPAEAAECLDELLHRFPAMLQHNEVLAIRKDIQVAVRVDRWNKNKSFVGPSDERWRRRAFDYEERFVGHCNRTTDIKQANFFGADGRYIVAGSDDGNFFIWDRTTNRISSMLRGDRSIVNCVLPHPFACLLATSGLDAAVRLWSPHDADDSESAHIPKQVEDDDNDGTTDVYQAAYNNQLAMLTNSLDSFMSFF